MSRQLPDFLDSYLQWAIPYSEPHERLHRWCGISLIAAALKRKCHLIWDNETFPNLYIVLVAPSGKRKGSAIDKAEDFMTDSKVDLNLVKGVSSIRALVDQLAEYQQPLVLSGGTTTHSSMTVLAEEYTVFLGHDNKTLVDFLVKWWNCPKEFPYLTAHSGCQHILNVWVNILAGTTPVHLSSSLMSFEKGGGLAGRTLFIYAGEKGKLVLFPFLQRDQEELYEQLIHDYREIASLHGKFTVSEDYLEFWEWWYPMQDANPPDVIGEKFGGYIDRRAKTLMKVAMILSASESNEMVIKRRHAEKAKEFLDDIESVMEYAYTPVTRSELSEVVIQVSTMLARAKKIKQSELFRLLVKDMDPILIKNAITTLQAMHRIDIEFIKVDGIVVDRLLTYK